MQRYCCKIRHEVCRLGHYEVITGDIFPRIQKCSLYSLSVFLFHCWLYREHFCIKSCTESSISKKQCTNPTKKRLRICFRRMYEWLSHSHLLQKGLFRFHLVIAGSSLVRFGEGKARVQQRIFNLAKRTTSQ